MPSDCNCEQALALKAENAALRELAGEMWRRDLPNAILRDRAIALGIGGGK
jgi:hypothetical protein